MQKYYRYLNSAFQLLSVELALSNSIYILIYAGNGIILTIKWFLILLGVNGVNFISIRQGVQMGTSFADYIERKKTGIELIKRVVFKNTSGCNEQAATPDLKVKKLREAKKQGLGRYLLPKEVGQGANWQSILV